ncbi:MAG: tetratricopeptide repeat protein [Hespellia sp.]|nr:tetratricopeptide repeat protein [Hespellia sp.]
MEYTEKIVYQSNYWYNDGLGKAQIRDLSGAITSLRRSLQYNRENVDSRNLLGLVYYGRGEVAEALVEWIISKNLQSGDNIANYYISQLQNSQGELDAINQAVKKFNQSLVYCNQEGEDLAIIQLRKVIASHPTFLKAYQLLALLYLHTEQYAKARQALRVARKLDTTNEMTLRYTHEIAQIRERKSTEAKGTAAQSVTYKMGNETIIQPASAAMKGMTARITIVNLLLGILLGAAVVWFLIVPAVDEAKVKKMNDQIIEFSDQIAAQEAQISAQTKALDEFRATSDETEAAAATAASAKESYESLMTVSDQYNDGSYSSASMAEILLGVNRDALGEGGQTIYDRLAEAIFPIVCERQYAAGVSAINDGDYETAITALSQVIQMDESYEDGSALLQLGIAYARKEDTENANTQFQKVIQLFPGTDNAQTAQNALEGNLETQSDGDSDDDYDDSDYSDDSYDYSDYDDSDEEY